MESTNFYIIFQLFKQKKTKQQKSDRRSRANVLRAFQLKVELFKQFRASYRPPTTLNKEFKVDGLVIFGQLNIFGTNAIFYGTNDSLFWYKGDWFFILVLVNTHRQNAFF